MNNMNVIVSNKSAYKWTEDNGIFFSGYFQIGNDIKVYKNKEAISLLSKVKDIEALESFLQNIHGLFSFIINTDEFQALAVDIARSMPLYIDEKGLIVSDNADAIRSYLRIDNENVDPDNFLELLACDYLFGDKTVYSQIKQLDLGEYVVIDGKTVIKKRYFYHINSITNLSLSELKKQLSEVSLSGFIRIKEAIAGRPVVLSMSGGYDSRYVGAMLKKVGVENVLCYTYGKANNFEIVQSRKNAEALGFDWYCTEYTDEEVRKCIDEIGLKYIDSYTGHDFIAYIQNFMAVRSMHEKGIIKPNSVFITGLCGDMPTGNYIPDKTPDKVYTDKSVVELTYERLFKRFKMPNDFKDKWQRDLLQSVKEIPIKVEDYQSWVTVSECVYTGTCHPHWFLNMNKVHEFFGYEWLLPYWDKDLLLMWYSVPAEIKKHQLLYEDWLLNDICGEYGIGQKKFRASYSRNETIRKIMYGVGKYINFICLNLGIIFRRKYDECNFAPLELALFRSLNTKKTVLYEKAGIQYLLNQFILQRRYGVGNMNNAIRRLNINKNIK